MLAIFPFAASDGQPEQVKRKTPRGSEFLAELLPCEGSYQPLSRLESEMNDSRPSGTGPAPDAGDSPALVMPAPAGGVGSGVPFLEDAQALAFSESVYTRLGDSQPGLALRAMLETAAVDALAQRLATRPAPSDWTTFFRDAHDLLAAWADRELADEGSPLSNASIVLDVDEMAGLSVVTVRCAASGRRAGRGRRHPAGTRHASRCRRPAPVVVGAVERACARSVGASPARGHVAARPRTPPGRTRTRTTDAGAGAVRADGRSRSWWAVVSAGFVDGDVVVTARRGRPWLRPATGVVVAVLDGRRWSADANRRSVVVASPTGLWGIFWPQELVLVRNRTAGRPRRWRDVLACGMTDVRDTRAQERALSQVTVAASDVDWGLAETGAGSAVA